MENNLENRKISYFKIIIIRKNVMESNLNKPKQVGLNVNESFCVPFTFNFPDQFSHCRRVGAYTLMRGKEAR